MHQLAKLRLLWIFWILNFPPIAHCAEQDENFLYVIAPLKYSRPRTTETVAETDAMADKLLKSYSQPQQQALIYYSWANAYAQSGLSDRLKIIEKGRMALENLQDDSLRMRTYVYIGDAQQTMNPKEFNHNRTTAATTYLQGLKELLERHNLPESAPPMPPGIERFHDLAPGTPEYEAVEKQNREFRAAREEAETVGQLVKHREVIQRQIVDLYRRPPYAVAEIDTLAKQVGLDATVAKSLTQRAEAAAAKLPKRPVAEPNAENSLPRLVLVTVSVVILMALATAIYLRRRTRASLN